MLGHGFSNNKVSEQSALGEQRGWLLLVLLLATNTTTTTLGKTKANQVSRP